MAVASPPSYDFEGLTAALFVATLATPFKEAAHVDSW
jgi:hypothetical protein